LTSGKVGEYNQIAGWRGILLSPASFSLKTLAPHQPACLIKFAFLDNFSYSGFMKKPFLRVNFKRNSLKPSEAFISLTG